MTLLRIIGLFVVLLVVCVPSSLANPVTFTFQGTASGSIGATPFANTAFTIIGFGDTANRLTHSQGFFINHSSATVSLSGIGNFTFNLPTLTFVNNTTGVAGFSLQAGIDLLHTPVNASLFAWDMLSSIGPIAGTGAALQWTNMPVSTSGGQLVFQNGPLPITFTAGVNTVPEPASLTLFVLGVGGAGIRLLRRRKS